MTHQGAHRGGMDRLRSQIAAVFACALLAACASAPNNQNAAAVTGDGISGTGMVAENASDDGISGTGMVARVDGGDGIGGTGVVGTISGFGSIIVNGLKLEYDTSTSVASDGRPAVLTDLRVGQVIEGMARRDRRGDLRLEHLEIRHAVTGPISEIDYDNESLVVLGQIVRVNLAGDKGQRLAFASLKIGDVVNVSGLRMEDGMIVASRLDQTDEDGRMLVRGPVASTSENTVTIGGLTIDLSDAALADTLAAGNRAFVAGRMLDDAFSADVVIAKQSLPFDNAVSDVSLEGYVPQEAGAPLSVQGVAVAGLTLPGDVKPGDRVVVTGRIGADGGVVAREIARVRTVITVLRPAEMMRPAQLRPATIERLERIERPQTIERPTVPERPQRERPESYRPPMV
jgi:hypothetical protein